MKIQFLAILTLFGLSACAMPSLDALTEARQADNHGKRDRIGH
jgi:hypothetical protein